MNIDSKTIGIIMAISVQSVSLVWFISKMDNRIANGPTTDTLLIKDSSGTTIKTIRGV